MMMMVMVSEGRFFELIYPNCNLRCRVMTSWPQILGKDLGKFPNQNLDRATSHSPEKRREIT